MKELLTTETRTAISLFLAEKGNPDKSVIVCEKGFLDATEGCVVSDAVALTWFEGEGGKFSEIFS